MVTLQLLAIFLLLNLLLVGSILTLSKKYHFDRFDGMCRGKKVPARMAYRIIRQEGAVLYLNVTVNVTEDIYDEPLSTTSISRCRSKENLDTCEHILTSSPVNLCNLINPKFRHVSPYYIEYTPPFGCPIRKNIYRAHSAKLDFSPYFVFPLGDWFWKTVTEIRHTKTRQLLHCLMVDVYHGY